MLWLGACCPFFPVCESFLHMSSHCCSCKSIICLLGVVSWREDRIKSFFSDTQLQPSQLNPQQYNVDLHVKLPNHWCFFCFIWKSSSFGREQKSSRKQNQALSMKFGPQKHSGKFHLEIGLEMSHTFAVQFMSCDWTANLTTNPSELGCWFAN